MDLRERLLELLGGASLGDRVGEGVLVGASSELGLRLSFEVDGRAVHVEVALADANRPAARRTRRLAVSYRSGDDDAFVEPGVGLPLCDAVARIAAENEDRVLAAIATDAARARVEDDGGTRLRDVAIDRALELGGTPRAPHYTLTPYVGCLVGCRFCYAQRRVAEVRRLELLPETPWGSFVDARTNVAAILADELATLAPLPIKFCPIVSDPYQALEATRRLTRACLEVIARAPGFAAIVLTRCRLVERDAELLGAIGAFGGMSVPTIDDAVRRHFEPRAASVAERFEVLATLRTRGVRTFAVVQPILPGSIAELADALAGVVSSVFVDVLHGVEGATREFDEARYAFAKDGAWQRDREEELRAALAERGVAVWEAELPPELVPSVGRQDG
jgi:DNA repair photolyase